MLGNLVPVLLFLALIVLSAVRYALLRCCCGPPVQGLTYEEATANFWILDADGLITVKREKQLSSTVEPFARKTQADVEGEKLAATVLRVPCSLHAYRSIVHSPSLPEVLSAEL